MSKKKREGRWRRLRAVPGKIIIYFVLICIGFVYLEPILEMIAKAMMSAQDIVDPSVTWIPKTCSFDNLRIAAQVLKLEVTLRNSILFSGGLALAQTIVSAMTAYALSRFDFKGKRFWFVMIILTFIMPVPVLMVPRLMMLVTAQTATGIQLVGSTILVVFLFSFVWNWNETYITSTLLRGNLPLLPAKLNLFNSEFESAASAVGGAFRLNEAYKMSATLISISPLVLLYVFVQRKFIQGIENTGITGE